MKNDGVLTVVWCVHEGRQVALYPRTKILTVVCHEYDKCEGVEWIWCPFDKKWEKWTGFMELYPDMNVLMRMLEKGAFVNSLPDVADEGKVVVVLCFFRWNFGGGWLTRI